MACGAKGVQCKTAEKSKNKGMVHMFYSTFLTPTHTGLANSQNMLFWSHEAKTNPVDWITVYSI